MTPIIIISSCLLNPPLLLLPRGVGEGEDDGVEGWVDEDDEGRLVGDELVAIVGDALAGIGVGCTSPGVELESLSEGEPVGDELGDIDGLVPRDTNLR